VGVDEIATIYEQGHLQETGNALDFAIEGNGFFAIETPSGEKYSRNGTFTLNRDGFLATANGDYVLGTGGRIQIGGGQSPIFGEDGRIWVEEGGGRREIGQLRIVDFKDKRGLRKVGDSWYEATPESGAPIDISATATVKSGFLEKSNVNVVLEMVKMIQTSRIYEANSRTIRTHDDILNRTINQVGRKV
jgi:flagellar basal-body rod protein FlgG